MTTRIATTAHANGYAWMRDPRLNRGTAFSAAERHSLALEGLLPPAISSLEIQIARRHDEIDALSDDLQKYLVLSDLQARNDAMSQGPPGGA